MSDQPMECRCRYQSSRGPQAHIEPCSLCRSAPAGLKLAELVRAYLDPYCEDPPSASALLDAAREVLRIAQGE